MKEVSSSVYFSFIEAHLGHIAPTGRNGYIEWVDTNCPLRTALAVKQVKDSKEVYQINQSRRI